MKSQYWTGLELGTHRYADKPHYSIHRNGSVEINPESFGSNNKIELRVKGMYRITKDWLSSNHMLDEQQRAELIDLIASRGDKIYNPRTKEWE
ncbi:hypothetical protein [Rossellomorea sp. RS05]|uniref:hypothetical protein n=1 Tax=Rossellomorea sp. RS05 TaxID=3149166 RepID=UPI0032214327